MRSAGILVIAAAISLAGYSAYSAEAPAARVTYDLMGSKFQFEILDPSPTPLTGSIISRIFNQARNIKISYLPVAPGTFQDRYARDKESVIREAPFATEFTCRTGSCAERAPELLEVLSRGRRITGCPEMYDGGIEFKSDSGTVETIYVSMTGNCVQVGSDYLFIDSRTEPNLNTFFDRIVASFGAKELLGRELRPNPPK